MCGKRDVPRAKIIRIPIRAPNELAKGWTNMDVPISTKPIQ